ncbi:helix-turn-helix transcriptional regulator [Eubacteriaceae bacterium ES2]|nr:helix-turn-helix transcriptional regulator [Eubacteriaceae bacterium ES2]
MLSTRIEELMIESGETVQSLAEMMDVDRTTLQKIKTGKRLPTREILNRLIAVLRLSKAEENELVKLFDIEKNGARKYKTRMMVKELLEMISELTEYKMPVQKQVDTKSLDCSDGDNQGNEKIVKGRENVIALMHQVIDREIYFQEEPQISMLTSNRQDYLYHYIFQEMMGNKKKLRLQDVIAFDKESYEDDMALSSLKFLMGISLLENVSYDSNYLTVENGQNSSGTKNNAYFILTAKEVLVISKDLKIGVRYRNQERIDYYSMQFRMLSNQSEQFIIENDNPLFLYTEFDTEYKPLMVLEPIPCFANYFTAQFVENKIRKDFPFYPALLPFAIKFYGNLRENAKNMKNVFSYKYLEQFMEIGELYLPEVVTDRVTPPERLALLKLVRQDLASGKHPIYMIRDDAIFMNDSFECSDAKASIQIIFHYRIRGHQIFKSISLRKTTIQEAFKDFFDHLPDSDLVLSEQETLKKLDILIDRYEKIAEYNSFIDPFLLGGAFNQPVSELKTS